MEDALLQAGAKEVVLQEFPLKQFLMEEAEHFPDILPKVQDHRRHYKRGTGTLYYRGAGRHPAVCRTGRNPGGPGYGAAAEEMLISLNCREFSVILENSGMFCHGLAKQM